MINIMILSVFSSGIRTDKELESCRIVCVISEFIHSILNVLNQSAGQLI